MQNKKGRKPLDVELRKEAIRNAVAAELKAGMGIGQTPMLLANVAQKIGLTSLGLHRWASSNDISLCELIEDGIKLIYVESRGKRGRAPLDVAERKEAIHAAVAELKAEGKEPTVANVAEKMELSYNGLQTWARNNGINLADLGVEVDERRQPVDVEARKEEIKKAVVLLKAYEIVPYLDVVAVLIKRIQEPLSLQHWASRHGVDLYQLGVARKSSSHQKKQQVEAEKQKFEAIAPFLESLESAI